MRVGDRDAQLTGQHHRNVDHIVADIGRLLSLLTQQVQQILQSRQLGSLPLLGVLDAQRSHPVADDARTASGDDANLDADLPQRLEAETIFGMEGF